MMMGFTVKIDDREKHSRIEHAKDFFKDKGDETHVQKLPFGDYIFDDKVVFEYKSLEDFVKSIKSQRVFNQALDQSTIFPYHFVITVSTQRERRGYFNKLKHLAQHGLYFDESQYIGAIARLNTYTTVIQATTETEAFEFMRSQARKCLDNKHLVKRLEQKTDNPCFNWLMNIKHISDKKAELVVKELELETLTDLLEVTNNDLQAIDGIGSVTAGIIMKSIKR